ncbi:MAG: UDP-3-O-(3-hydroxymyristoyl)glucosamine N-acyltransferase [Alphaproteobacteria bacterium]
MPDPRFFVTHEPLSVSDVARLTGAQLTGPAEARISQVAPLSQADQSSLAFFADKRRARELAETHAAAVLVTQAGAASVPKGCEILITSTPQVAWGKIASVMHQPITHDAQGGAVHPTAHIGQGVVLGPGVVVGQGAAIGTGTVVHGGAVIGPGVQIGRNCVIGANASLAFALLGDGVSILAGARIGEAGFGVAGGDQGAVDIPQLGRAILQDNVTIGANSCVDRGAWDDTVIGENSKLDNLVHVAHNVRMGRNCRLAAYTGISGSVVIGDGAIFGGKAGVADQLTIGEGAAIGASASVFKSVPPREVWTGFPARPMRRWLREQAVLARLSRGRKGTGHDEEG